MAVGRAGDTGGEAVTRLTTDLPGATCPSCGAIHNATTASPANPDATPVKGDVTLCAGGGELLQFTDGMQLVRVPLAGLAAEELRAVQSARRLLQRRRFPMRRPS